MSDERLQKLEQRVNELERKNHVLRLKISNITAHSSREKYALQREVWELSNRVLTLEMESAINKKYY